MLYEYNATYGGIKDAIRFSGNTHYWKNVTFDTWDDYGFDYYFHVKGVENSITEIVFENVTCDEGPTTSTNYKPMYFEANKPKLTFKDLYMAVPSIDDSGEYMLYILNQYNDVTISDGSEFKPQTDDGGVDVDSTGGVYVDLSSSLTQNVDIAISDTAFTSDTGYNHFAKDLVIQNNSSSYYANLSVKSF